jgi:predicted DNA-binding WGR domain protein
VTSLSIRLEARSAAHRCYRAYAIEVATDLFGAWLVDMNYGRIGTIGRSKIRSFATIEDAQDQVRACLRKRATAPRRIGVAYHVRRVDRNDGWKEPAFDDQLRGWFSADSRGRLNIMPIRQLSKTVLQTGSSDARHGPKILSIDPDRPERGVG